MELITIDKSNIKDFLNFYREQYLNNDLRRDTFSGLLKNILYGRTELSKSVEIEPLMVVNKDKTTMICLLAYAYRMPEYVQIGFFESDEYNMEAFKLILERALEKAKEKGASKLTGSLNIHVNYGLGFLADNFREKQSFGSSHNPEFYNDYFVKNGFKTINMLSYKKDMNQLQELINDRVRDKLKEIYSVREADFKNFKSEIEIYTKINNVAFRDHLFYYPRKMEEDYELFKDLKYLLRRENLLFVEREGNPVGFMLWYPDFNEIINRGRSVGVRTVIESKLFPDKIKTFKIVEMGVIPEERNKGAILALFDYCFKCTKGKYATVESSWILADNIKSKSFGIKWADGESKQYKAYVKELI